MMLLNICKSKPLVCSFSKPYFLKPTDYRKFSRFANYAIVHADSLKNDAHAFGHTFSPKRFFWECFPNLSRVHFHQKDKLSHEEFQLIYRYTSFNYVFYGQFISMLVIFIQLFYSAIMAYSVIYDVPFSLATGTFGHYSIKFDMLGYAILSLFTIQNLLLYFCSQSTPLRIYYNKEKNQYTIIFLGVNPFTVRHASCNSGELISLGHTTFGFALGNFKLRDHRILLYPQCFRSNEHFNRMLGDIY